MTVAGNLVAHSAEDAGIADFGSFAVDNLESFAAGILVAGSPAAGILVVVGLEVVDLAERHKEGLAGVGRGIPMEERTTVGFGYSSVSVDLDTLH